jgi:hypothetical protein
MQAVILAFIYKVPKEILVVEYIDRCKPISVLYSFLIIENN